MSVRITTTDLSSSASLPDLAPVPDPLLWQRRGIGMAAWGTALRIEVGGGPDRAARIASAIADLDVDGDPADLRTFVSLTFDRAGRRSSAIVPRRIVDRTAEGTRLIRIDPAGAGDDVPEPAPAPSSTTSRDTGHPDRIRYAGSSLPDLHWLEAVADLLRRIDAGEVDKVVLARDHAVWSQDPFRVGAIAARLHARFPSCWTFHHDGLVGATPELLLARRGRDLRSLVLAGTTRRDPDPAIDERLGRALLASAKDRREHAAAAESVVAGLRSVATDVDAPDEPELLELDNLRHLATPVRATLAGGTTGAHAVGPTAVEIADRLHPSAAVGGSPRGPALGLIERLEGMDRERYAAPVGWMDATGDGEFGIALRCARLSGARARLFAGAGIVAGSLPEEELAETRLKLLAMQHALQAPAA